MTACILRLNRRRRSGNSLYEEFFSVDKITVCLIKNPFNVQDRDIKQVDYSAVKTLAGYVADIGIDDDLAVSVNGGVVDCADWTTTIPAPDSYIVACPVIAGGGGGDGKNILSMVASIALTVVSMGAGSVFSGGKWLGAGMKAMSSWKFAGYLAAAAVMYVGGTLLNNMNSSVSVDRDYSTSSTYSWDTPKPQATQGGPIPLTYGIVKVANPIVLSAHVTTDGDKQYLNLLLCGGEGPVDSITDIRIDGNPIENYK